MNPTTDFIILSLSFEMASSKIIGRKLSYKTSMTTNQLYSGKYEERITDEQYKQLKIEAEKIKTQNIYYVDIPGTVDQVKETVLKFSEEPFAKGKWLIVILDHTLLTKGKSGESERAILSQLQYTFIELKKLNRNTIIQLSQLNRNIETPDRISNPSMHFPMRSDLMASDSIYQASDWVMVLHRPEILNIEVYGVGAWPTERLIYLHVIKARDGEPQILDFINNLKYNRIDEKAFNQKNANNLNNDA